jgi:hypothetical protein
MMMMENDAVPYEEGQNGIQAADALKVIGQIFDYAKEAKITEREVVRYRAMRDVAIKKITEEYKFKREYLNKTFAERKMALEKVFQLIDDGMEKNDYTKINMGLQGITVIIKDNPFKLFETTTVVQRHAMLEDGDFSIE